ncbi:MAG: endonuclease [Alphaproteobacteria bacterium]|nr:endonuclease [Alphaproteobacteria bacterium]
MSSQFVRIASFNVENLTDAPNGETPLAARLDILRPQLERLSADIVCLQEVDASKRGNKGPRELSALRELLSGTSYQDYHPACTVSEKTGKPRDKHNLVILSRWPILRNAQYAHKFVPPPTYRRAADDQSDEMPIPVEWDRPILHAEIALPDGEPLHVVNMHLKAPLAAYLPGQKLGRFAWKTVSGWAEGYFLASVKRSGQALEARILIDRLFDTNPTAMIAVAGDFNAEERETPLRIVMGDQEDTRNGRLASRSLGLLEHTLPENRRFTVIHRGRHHMLDHMMVSRQLLARYRSIEVHNEALGDELVAYTLIEAAPDSYHAPIVAEFA